MSIHGITPSLPRPAVVLAAGTLVGSGEGEPPPTGTGKRRTRRLKGHSSRRETRRAGQ